MSVNFVAAWLHLLKRSYTFAVSINYTILLFTYLSLDIFEFLCAVSAFKTDLVYNQNEHLRAIYQSARAITFTIASIVERQAKYNTDPIIDLDGDR